MTLLEKKEFTAAIQKASRAGKPKPLRPDPYRDVRYDARKTVEWTESQEVRGLVELRCIVMTKVDRVYEMVCLVQRNGLRSVQKRDEFPKQTYLKERPDWIK